MTQYFSSNTSFMDEMKQEEFALKKKLQKVPAIRTLEELIQELRRIFEDDKINVDYVKSVMSAYKSNPRDWKKYAKFDRHRYTRNLVDSGNGKYNLMVLAWAEAQGSSIHDHANSHCFMKVLSGSLREVRFAWPIEEDDQESGESREMVCTGENLVKTNEVAYINDSIGLHRMENQSHTEPAVSLHLYCPPFESVLLFDQRTGHKSRGKVTFWSEYGKKTSMATEEGRLDDDEYENN